jgi:hypothetical protein
VAEINVPVGPIADALREELAALIRTFAESEAGPVGERLRQIAAVFEEDVHGVR